MCSAARCSQERKTRMSRRFGKVTALISFLMLMTVTHALAEKRVALVMGISKYEYVPQLPNPTRDAASIGEVFKKASFDVVEMKRDLSIADMRRVIRDFANSASDADVAVVYYAGHGIEVNGTNYLIPADARLLSDFDVEDETVSLDRVLKALDPAKKLRLVILDACRENPFQKTMKRSIGTRSIGRGLAEIEPQSTNTLIAFAAKAGALASDGDGGNSPFAAALMKHLASPGLDLRLAFGRVRDDVLKTTGNRQEPFVYGSLGGETVALVPQSAIQTDPTAEARRDYEFAAQIGTKQAWESFLAARPTGLYADLARAQFGKLQAAEQASTAAKETIQKAEEQAKLKTDEFRRQLEEQAKKQAEDAKRQYSEQSKKDLEAARQQVAEQAQRDVLEAKRQVEEARKQADDARRQVDEAKKQAIEDARRQVEIAKADAEKAKVASLTPNAGGQSVPAQAPVPAMEAADIARLLQAHLKRVGCDPGTTDGIWNEGSKRALEQFNKNANSKLDVKLASLDSLDAVRSKTSRVCPLVCGKGQKADGDRCVAITCDAGFAVGSDGTCKKRPDPPERKAVARTEQPARAAPAAPAGGGGGKCFSFNGKRYCE